MKPLIQTINSELSESIYIGKNTSGHFIEVAGSFFLFNENNPPDELFLHGLFPISKLGKDSNQDKVDWVDIYSILQMFT